MRPIFYRTPGMFVLLILALALFIGPSAGESFYQIPDFDMEDKRCKFLASSIINLDNHFVGVASIFFPELRMFATKYDTFAHQRNARETSTLRENNSTDHTLTRKKRFDVFGLFSEGASLLVSGTLETLNRIAEDKFVENTLDKMIHVVKMFPPCSVWLKAYIAYWYNIVRVILNDHYPKFFDA